MAAALGGARTVKNVDLSRKVLAWGQENYALSGLEAPDTDFLYGDVFGWLARLYRRGDVFDVVVLDPPGFSRSQGGVWRAERDYPGLMASAAAVTAPGGRVLALLNHAGVDAAAFERSCRAGLAQAGPAGRPRRRPARPGRAGASPGHRAGTRTGRARPARRAPGRARRRRPPRGRRARRRRTSSARSPSRPPRGKYAVSYTHLTLPTSDLV